VDAGVLRGDRHAEQISEGVDHGGLHCLARRLQMGPRPVRRGMDGEAC
jgi:hypothetical protein